MRVRRDRLRRYYVCAAQIKKDKEKNTHTEYGPPVAVAGVIWPASGKLQAELYGQRLAYIKNCKVDGKYSVSNQGGKISYELESGVQIREGDGVCVYSDQEPDHRIISIKPYKNLSMELEKI